MINSTDKTIALEEASKKGALIIFCGAGISMLPPSCSPSWWEIYQAASSALIDNFHESFPTFNKQLNVDELLSPFSTQQIADLIVNQFAGATFLEKLQVVDVADPNENHRLLASLSANGNLAGIVTTNFDTLLERSASVLDYSFSISYPEMAISPPVSASSIPLIKLHGTTVDATNMIETLDHKARKICPKLAQSWSEIIPGKDLLVIGYSGADLNFGAARAFFDAFTEKGGRLWWLYRPGSEISLVKPFKNQAILIEGTLPELLRKLAGEVGALDFKTPVSGRDAHVALQDIMKQWVKELHIGRWSAAVFLLDIVIKGRHGKSTSDLLQFLMDLALMESERVKPGIELNIDDLSLAGFLSKASIRAMETTDFESAVVMSRASVNIHEAFHKALSIANSDHSVLERHVNLCSVWSNYGHSLVMLDKVSDAVEAFTKAMENAYFGGHIKGFLLSLQNLINYGIELNDVRRSLEFVEAGIRLADKKGAVQASIELRLLIVMFWSDRNEIWSASKVLVEATRRAEASGDLKSLMFSRILNGYLLLRRGLVREGLTSIASAILEVQNTALFFRPIEEVRRYLEIIGVPQNKSFTIELLHNQIPDLIEIIDSSIKNAKAEDTLPWKGKHCSVSPSNGDDNLRVLFQVGVFEFEGNSKEAVNLSLQQAQNSLSTGHFIDAKWCAHNLLSRPDIGTVERGYAHAYMAHACGQLAEIQEVEPNLRTAQRLFEEAKEELPLTVANLGVWHSIQLGDSETAIRWVRLLARGLAKSKPDEILAYTVMLQSWGEPVEKIAHVFHETLITHGYVSSLEYKGKIGNPYRFFTGVTTELIKPVQKEVTIILEKVSSALTNNAPDLALNLINELLANKSTQISEYQAGKVVALLIESLIDKMSPDKLNSVMDQFRKDFLSQFSFSSVAQLETAMAKALISKGHHNQAVEVLRQRSFIGEFARDSLVRASLFACEEQATISMGQKIGTLNGMVVEQYFGISQTLSMYQVSEQSSVNNSNKAMKEIFRAYSIAISQAVNEEEVYDTVTKALRSLKRMKLLSRIAIAKLRGDRANWFLRMEKFDEAIYDFQKTTRSMRNARNTWGAINSIAGEARAYSRQGQYLQAVNLFEGVLKKNECNELRPNLLLGLAAAHLLEAQKTEVEKETLRELAIASYREAIDSATLGEMDRPLGRLGLARALGENGDQEIALKELDRAISELSHLGSTTAKILIENRPSFEAAEWSLLGLF
ncbi:MAG: hypothetical protein GQ475_07310 [Methylococcaceae bacterium]|nr:hypothetical protein [Methylococcaceae bacterium]